MERRARAGLGYRRLAELLKEKIERGDYPIGELLPSYDAIAAEYQTTKNVARDAVASLREEGIVETLAGVGSNVLVKPSEAPGSERDQIMRQIARIQERVDQLAEQQGEQARAFERQGREIAQLRQLTTGQPGAPVRRAG